MEIEPYPLHIPAGNDTEVQYNNGGIFGGDPTFTFDDSTKLASASDLDVLPSSSSVLSIAGTLFNANFANTGFCYVVGDYCYLSSWSTDTFSIVDVSDPSAPTLVSQLQDNINLNGCECIVVVGNYAYVACFNNNSITVIDISDKSTPVIAKTFQDATNLSLVIAIEVSGHYLWCACYDNAANKRVTSVDISDPLNPVVVGSLLDAINFGQNTYIVIKGDYAYVASRATDTFSSINISDPTNPTLAHALTNAAFNGAATIDIKGQYAFVVGRENNYLTSVDISDPNAMVIAHSLQDNINLNRPITVQVEGNYAYVACITGDTLTIVDISDPTAMSVVTSIQDSTNLEGIDDVFIYGKYAYVTCTDAQRLSIVELPGIEASVATIGNIHAHRLNVSENIIAGKNLTVADGITVGQRGIGSVGPIGLANKIKAGTQAAPIDVTTTRQHGLEFHYSGNNYNVTGIRSRAQLVTTDTTATALGGLFQAANNDDIDAGVLMGFMAEAIGKSTANASTITTMRGGLIGTEWGAFDTVTTLKTLHLRGHSLNAAGAGSFGTGYALYIENEAVGGNGQAYDAGIYFKGTNLSAGNKAYTYGIDFSGGTYSSEEIKLANGSVIGSDKITLQPTADSTTFFQILDADGGTPIFNVDSTNERVGIGTNTPLALLHTEGTAVVGRETLWRACVSDAARDFLSLSNGTTVATAFMPSFFGGVESADKHCLEFRGATNASNDTGTFPIVRFYAMTYPDADPDPVNAVFSNPATRPLFHFGNVSAPQLVIDAAGTVIASAKLIVKEDIGLAGNFEIGNDNADTSFIMGQGSGSGGRSIFLWDRNATPANAYIWWLTGGYANDIRIDAKNIVLQANSGNNVGIGELLPETPLEITDATPYITLHNSTHEDTDGGRESRLNFKGEQSGGEETTLARIEISHDGAADDEKGKVVISTNATADTDTPTDAVFIDSSQQVGIGNAPTLPLDVKAKSGHTAIGGFAIKLTNKTGAVTVAGQLVKADTATDDAVILAAAGEVECFGAFLDSGIADAAEAWVVVSGIADVAFDDNVAATRGDWVSTGVLAGYAAAAASPAAAPTHFEEIGHCIESVVAGGVGTHILARCVLHFN